MPGRFFISGWLPPLRSQHGVALMVMMIILVLGTLAILVNSLGSVSKTIARDEKTMMALTQAKEALIAYAVSNPDRPGNLPCPDRHPPGGADSGTQSAPCSSSGKTAIGRLPWKELGIPEPFDSTGEPLWYVVSDNFTSAASRINSNTSGTFSVYDASNALLTPAHDQVVAVVFAPGAPVSSQSRSTATTPCSTTGTPIRQDLCATNYLESASGKDNASATGPYISAARNDLFNDQLVYLSASQLMNNVENRVARELKAFFTAYYAMWSAFPFAAPFSDPTSANYSGASNTLSGLLPVNSLIEQDTSLPAWNSPPSISFSDGGTYLGYCELRNGNWPVSRWRCCKNSSNCSTTVTIPAGVSVTITGQLNHVGKGIWDLHDKTNTNEVRVKDAAGNTVLASSVLDNVNISGTLNADGSANITFSATAKTGGSQLQRIELRDITAPASSLPTWFAANHWREVMTYALSPGFAPGGNHTCTPACISVNGTPASAVIAATGAGLSFQSRPTGTWTDYLEGSNALPASGVYENRTLAHDFNDRIVVIAP